MNAPTACLREQVSEAEWQLRVDLAACYRLVALHGWDDLVFTHISVRLPGPEHHFLINPFGMMFDEITASSLVKVDMECRPLLPTPYPVNPAGFVIHSAIHAAREDVVCVIHTHTPAGVALSAQADGLLALSQHSTVLLHTIGYHDYEGLAVRDDEKPRLQRDLGSNDCLILRNHGLLTVGGTVADAFLRMFNLQRSCEIQLLAQSTGKPLTRISQDVLDGVHQAMRVVSAGQTVQQLVWPALLRKLDRANPGYDR
jgi:ribulose-5-phosphate 4-epimerase/fuculose-1-phosphate aldolase